MRSLPDGESFTYLHGKGIAVGRKREIHSVIERGVIKIESTPKP